MPSISVISPEGASSILWCTPDKAADAAAAMNVAAQDLMGLGVIDGIVREPAGGAQRNPAEMARTLADALASELMALEGLSKADLLRQREERFLAIGAI